MANLSKFIGLANLTRKLNNISRVDPDDLETGLRLGGQLIANEAKVQAPVLTGQLRRSIRVSVKVSGADAEARIGTNLEYARRVEFGFIGADKLGRRYNQAALPYLRPAARAKRKAALKEIRDAISRSIRRKAGGRI